MDEVDPTALSRRQLIQAGAATFAAAQTGAVVTELATAPPAQAHPAAFNAARYIFTRLRQHNVTTLFGIPGKTCEQLFTQSEASGMATVVTSSDFEAGYAADGYARVRGLGAVAATYGVGTMSLIGAISGAYAERSPVVVLNGGPSAEDLRIQREFGVNFSHSNGRPQSDLAMFREVTAYAARAATAAEVPTVVDRAIKTALTKQRPVYIEIAKDVWDLSVPAPQGSLDLMVPPSGEEARLAAAIVARLKSAARPVLLLGIEIDRYRLTSEITALAAKLQVPWATTLLAKSVIAEQTPGFIGVYSGDRPAPTVARAMNASDAVLAIGCMFGRQFRRLATKTENGRLIANDAVVLIANDQVRLGNQAPVQASLKGVIAELNRQSWRADPAISAATRLAGLSFEQRRAGLARPTQPPRAASETGLTYDETLSAISGFLDDTFITVTDTSLSMYPAADLNVTGAQAYVCNCIWQSIGFSLGAAVGVGIGQSRRPFVICGDGGFQTSAQALSTMVARNLRAIVVVLDNGHYAIEQWLIDGRYFEPGANGRDPPRGKPFLALNPWKYADFAKALGFKVATTVGTLAEFTAALTAARSADGPVLISVQIKPHDLPAGLA